MIFMQLSEPKYSFYLEESPDGLVCNKADTPDEILEEFFAINKDHKTIFGKDFITFIFFSAITTSISVFPLGKNV